MNSQLIIGVIVLVQTLLVLSNNSFKSIETMIEYFPCNFKAKNRVKDALKGKQNARTMANAF